MKAHESSVGELRWPGAGAGATPGPGHIATLGDSGTFPWVDTGYVAECVLGMMGPGDAGMSAAVAEW